MRSEVLSRGDARWEVHLLRLSAKTKRGPSSFAKSVIASDLQYSLGATSRQILSSAPEPDEDGLWELVVRVVWISDEDPS